ncbi:MAG: hypothetical protein LBE35_10070 [Clostridiales bacterium]|nr:hypothetical protein [Clostridiales bacterium]
MKNKNPSTKPKPGSKPGGNKAQKLFGKTRQRSKIALTALMAMVFTVIASLTVFASDPVGITPFDTSSINIAEQMGTALNGMVAQIFEVIAVILPIALLVIGAVVAIRRSISLLQSLVQR